MIFLFKKKELHLDVFTYRPEVLEYYPVDYASKFYPEWWKKLPKEYEEEGKFWPTSTMKRCVGFTDYYRNGIVVPLWSDLAIKTHPLSFNWQFSDRKTQIQVHQYEQMQGYLDPNQYSHAKIVTPWALVCKEDVNFVWTQPTWNFERVSDIIIPPAVVNYKHNSGTNINVFFDKREEKKFIIPAGQPMVNMIPATERRLVIHKHLVDEPEFLKKSISSYESTFVNKYRNNKSITESNESRCPFGFGSK